MSKDRESLRYWARKRSDRIYWTCLTLAAGYMIGEFIHLLLT
jgi:hypothetical protein